jgi:hypothetical protein
MGIEIIRKKKENGSQSIVVAVRRSGANGNLGRIA